MPSEVTGHKPLKREEVSSGDLSLKNPPSTGKSVGGEDRRKKERNSYDEVIRKSGRIHKPGQGSP